MQTSGRRCDQNTRVGQLYGPVLKKHKFMFNLLVRGNFMY
jgi:hypothetical protein